MSDQSNETPNSLKAKEKPLDKWNKNTETSLKLLVTLGKIHDWSKVAAFMSSEYKEDVWTQEECKERWEAIIGGPDSKKSWTEEEELEMLIVHRLCNNKWSNLAGLINGRNNNSIKNRFYSIFRKVKNKVKRLEVCYNTRIELLQMLYMISLMEIHLFVPYAPVIQKGRRGKDYVFNLLQDLCIDEIIKFKIELAQKIGKEERLRDLWEELAIPIEKTKFQLPDNIKKFIENNKFLENGEGCYDIEKMGIAALKTKILLPDPNFVNKPLFLTEEEKSLLHAQVFLSKVPQIVPTYNDPISTGISQNHSILLSPGITSMQPEKICKVEEPKKKGYGDFSALTRPQTISPLLDMQPQIMHQPMIIHRTPLQVGFPRPAGFIIQPVYHVQSPHVMGPMTKPEGTPFGFKYGPFP